jgi:hypothetical protein
MQKVCLCPRWLRIQAQVLWVNRWDFKSSQCVCVAGGELEGDSYPHSVLPKAIST